MPGHPAIRATDADREATVVRLRDASVSGCLTLEELSDRTGLAHAARTREELAALVRDLPVVPGPTSAGETRREWAVFSRLSRGGRWLPAERCRFVSVCGTIELDLRDAVLHGPVLDIEITSWFGTTTLLVPEGVEVQLDAGGISATHEVALHGAPVDGGPLVRVHTSGGFGTTRVRYRPRRRDTIKAAVRAVLFR